MIRDFSDVLQQKFDIGDYSLFENIQQNQRCKEAYTFWICSTHLPMWLLNSDNKNSVKVEACQSTCLTVEKQCPFLIKGTEDDMASGNPSFMCKDANVPDALSSTMCCYDKVTLPEQGEGVSINVSTGFCHEPDHVQLNNKNLTSAGQGPPSDSSSGWSAAAGASSSADTTADSSLVTGSKQTSAAAANTFYSALPSSASSSSSTADSSSSSNFHSTSSCDKLLWPSPKLNVTTSKQAALWSKAFDLNATAYDLGGRSVHQVAGRLPAVSSATEESEGENFIVAWFRSLGGATSSATNDQPEETTDYHSSNKNNKEAAENDERAWPENESSHAHNQAFTTTTSSSGAKGVVIPKYYLIPTFWTKSWTTKTTEQIASMMTHTSLITTLVVVLDMMRLHPFLYNDGMR
jgi:hypothetical protein